jgi:hypothetical protein
VCVCLPFMRARTHARTHALRCVGSVCACVCHSCAHAHTHAHTHCAARECVCACVPFMRARTHARTHTHTRTQFTPATSRKRGPRGDGFPAPATRVVLTKTPQIIGVFDAADGLHVFDTAEKGKQVLVVQAARWRAFIDSPPGRTIVDAILVERELYVMYDVTAELHVFSFGDAGEVSERIDLSMQRITPQAVLNGRLFIRGARGVLLAVTGMGELAWWDTRPRSGPAEAPSRADGGGGC